MRKPFLSVKTLKPSRSVFDLSHDKLMTGDMGKLYPILAMEMNPGDTFKFANEIVLRMQPLNAPILHEISVSTHYFFCPYRILMEEWTDFISGGTDGEYGGSSREGDLPSEAAIALPRWRPTNNAVGSLWDYLGFPVDVVPEGALPLDFIRRCYNRIWNEYYRDETLQDEVSEENEDILSRNWKKDYFTSALQSQQRGVAPAMPLSGSVPVSITRDAVFSGSLAISSTYSTSLSSLTGTYSVQMVFVSRALTEIEQTATEFSLSSLDYVITNIQDQNLVRVVNVGVMTWSISGGTLTAMLDVTYTVTASPSATPVLRVNGVNCILSRYSGAGDLSDASSFDVKDIRLAFQIQRWLELANRGGVRYTEFLRSFFGVSPRDDRLQRPEYIGGSKQPVIISEVLQTSSTDNEPTPQGNMAGHGISTARTYVGRYTAVEYGIVMGLMSIMPTPKYQQGINRQWLRRTKFDFLFPQFTHLSEQAIEEAEIYATNSENDNRRIFGYNEVYDELRYMPSIICGKMRDTFDYWHLARKFSSAPALNSDFIKCNPSKRIFAVPSEDGFIISVGNYVRAVRPLPRYGTPGGV